MTVMEPVVAYLLKKNWTKVSLNQVIKGSGRPRRPVLRVLDRMAKEGLLEEIADNPEPLKLGEVGPPRRNPTWLVISKPSMPSRQPQRITVRDRIWKAIRMKRRFAKRELRNIIGCSPGSIDDYVTLLDRAGYIRVIGKDRRAKCYMLIKDAGPKRPEIAESVRKSENEVSK